MELLEHGKFKSYPAINLAQYFVSLYRWHNLLETPSDFFVYAMVFIAHGFCLKSTKKKLIREDLIFDGKDILIPTLINIKKNKTLEFVDFKNLTSACDANPYVQYYLSNIYQDFVSFSDKELKILLCKSEMPRAECQRRGLKVGQKINNKLIYNCFL